MTYLEQLLYKESFHLPLLLHGGEAHFLEERALHSAQKILRCTGEIHPDLLLLRPDPKSSTFVFAQLKEALQSLILPPHEGKYKILLLLEIEKMYPLHISALLKTLEEKPPYVVVFLTTTKLEALLPTILSRVIKIFLDAPEQSLVWKELLAPVLEAALRQEYATLYRLLEELSPKMEEEGALEHCLTGVLAFFRDLEILRSHSSAPLYFAAERSRLQKLLSYPLVSYTDLLEALETTELAFQTHTKAKSLLEYLFLSIGKNALS